MQTIWLVIGWIFIASTVCDGHVILQDGFVGIGLDLSKLGLGKDKKGCPPSENFTCACGAHESPFAVPVPLCSYVYRWKMNCKPCDNLKPEDLCPRYALCQECNIDGGDSCKSCPPNKYGTWCENTCTCINGGTCERSGKCICPQQFEGKNCEKQKGCPPPPSVLPPVQVILQPPDLPVSAVYSCPSEYVLRGQAISTCVNGKWSSSPPTCSKKCPLLSAPANGRLVFEGSDLVEGTTAEITCNQGYRLVGQKILTCTAGGYWNSDLPICEELSSCPDPGKVQYAERTVHPDAVLLGGHFLQGSVIHYKCLEEYEQMGVSKIQCRSDGTWSNRLPTCLKVATVVPDCETPGSEIVAENGAPVRIFCPPECVEEEFKVWGTSIYRQESSVCQAAIHSSKLTNSGGPVAVINNGPYSHFTGSFSNSIQSERFDDKDESFRFDKLPPTALSRDSGECEKGLMHLENTCVYVPNLLRSYQEAVAVCTNLGLYMEIPSDPEEQAKLITILNDKGIKSIWADKVFQSLSNEGNTSSSEEAVTNDDTLCPSATVEESNFKLQNKQCQEVLNYICMRKTDSKNLAVCKDPGSLTNGKAEPIGQIDNTFYVGSSIKYSCDTVHYLNGEESISCTANGTWSAPKPTCIKVDACPDPPTPIGGFVTYLPPLKNQNAQRSAIYQSRITSSRTARLPVGLAAPIPANIQQISTTPEPVTVPLPPGLHRKGTRAMYDCESRYYKLIGSRTRRCQEMGEWSGRPPTCMPVCGRSDSPRSPFIVNGNATDIGQWPWQGGIARYLQDYDRWFLLCGAALLNEQWVITAAHCVTYAGTTLTIEPDKFQVYLGKYHRTDSKDDEYVQVRKIQEIHIHPDYDPGLFDADIALIRMDSPVQLNSRVQPVCLPTDQTTRENLVEGKKGVVTGWGMNENETYSETLQQAVLPVVSQANCEKGYEEADLPLTVTDNMFCAGYAQGRSDACSGDSGGPMVFTDDSSKERKWVLEGIVSWGSPRGCGNPNQYGGFTTVSKFLDWIHLYF